ncbi:MAG: hypothetical protein QGH50_08465, partial [SAR324 cluster bacterium]|nr:hypothetical protein [SAR324 cluster bacterium]
MSKFDRCIFISIAVGIWALAMTQVFESKIVVADDYSKIAREMAQEVLKKKTYGEIFSSSHKWMGCPKRSQQTEAELQELY